MAKTEMTIKLLVDKKANRILFAEASKDVVDFLFGLLSLPLASIINLLTKKKMVGSLGNLYDSVEILSSTYMQPNLNKDSILKPKSSFNADNIPLLLPNTDGKQPKYYRCCSCHSKYITDTATTRCPNCRNHMSTEVTYIDSETSNVASSSPSSRSSSSSSEGGGYVKGVVTYMVMDDLVVTPMSSISSIILLNKFNVQNVSFLEEKVVNITMKEGLELLRASLWSITVLSEVFLVKSETR